MHVSEVELCTQQGLLTNINFTSIAIVVCIIVWESPLSMCVCAEVLGGTRTDWRGSLHLLLQPRRKAPHANAAPETALTRVSDIDGTLHNLCTGLQLPSCMYLHTVDASDGPPIPKQKKVPVKQSASEAGECA